MATILLLEEEDDARPIIRHNLRRTGFDLLVAVDEQTALDWLTAGEGEWVTYMEDSEQLQGLLARLTHG